MNAYGFGSGDPITYSDPFGLCPIPPWDCVIGLSFIAEHPKAAKAAAITGQIAGLIVIGVATDGLGDLAALADLGEASEAVDATAEAADVAAEPADAASETKVFSDEKRALVDMAKRDKHLGITREDMQAYKDLNETLPDKFPEDKVRGPETHPNRGPAAQRPHGHVGPVDHIPVSDP